MAKYYYIGPWVKAKGIDGKDRWNLPDNTIGSFSLRSASLAQDQGLFCASVPILDSSYTKIGDGTDFRDYHTTQFERDAWRSILSLSIAELPDSITLFRDIVIKTFEELGDPEGDKRFFPPTATHRGNLEFFFGNELISRRKLTGIDDLAYKHLLPHLRNTYQKYYDAGIEARQKVLWDWERKYPGVPTKDFQPVGINEIAIRPTTTINDTFDRGNADALGTSSDGDWSWTEVQGDIDISGNKAVATAGGRKFARADKDLSSDDHYAQAIWGTAGGGNSNTGVAVRKDSSATLTFYYAWNRDTDDAMKIEESTDDSQTEVASGSYTISDGEVLKLTADGSTLTAYVDDVQKLQGSDSSISGNLRTGLQGYYAKTTWNNFQAADLAAGPSGNPWNYYLRNKMRRAA